MPKKILITGGAGFIGSHLAEKLLKQGEEVFVIDDLSTGTLNNIKNLKDNPNFHFLYRKDSYQPNDPFPLLELKTDEFYDDFLKGERRPISVLNDYSEGGYKKYFIGKIVKDEIIDEIYHLAAMVGVKLVVEQWISCFRNNIQGTDIVLSQANGNRNGREIKILIASSSEVYGKNNNPPFGENDDRTYGSVYSFRWAYAFSKAVDEYIGLVYHHDFKFPVVVVRFFNVIGPRQTGYYGMVVPTLVQQALKGEDLTVYGDGEQTRSFADVEDVVGALIELMAEKEAVGKVINLGSDREISINELAKKIKEQTKSTSKIVHIPYEQAYGAGFEDLGRRVPDLTQIKNLINYQPKVTLEESLEKIIKYFSPH